MTIKPVEGATAERFCEFYPKRMEAAIDMLAQNKSVKSICKKVRARYTTIKALKYRKCKEIAERKKMLADLSFEGAVEALEKQRELIPTLKHTAPAIVHGIFRDTFNSVTSEPPPPQPQLHVHVDVVAQFKELLEAANQKAAEMKQVHGQEIKQLNNGNSTKSAG